MKRDEKAAIIAVLESAVNRCHILAEEAETFEEKQYQWGQADGYYKASVLIAGRPEG